MLLPALLSLLLVPPAPSQAILLPPEGNDYPTYDYPPIDYLPHNTLVEYQDPRVKEADKSNVVIRSPYIPVPSSSSSASPPSSPSSSSSSSFPCTAEELAGLMTLDDLEKMIRVVARLEGMPVRDLLLTLANRYGLNLKTTPDVHSRKPVIDFQVPAVSARGSSSSSSSPGTIQASGDPLTEDLGVGVGGVGVGRRVPRALLVIKDRAGRDQARAEVDLGPRMALLDVLREANTVYALQHGPYRPNPFSLKAGRVGSDGCMGMVGTSRGKADLPSTPLHLTVTRTRPIRQVVWQSTCLPRVSELLVRSGDVIVLTPR